MAQSYTPYSYQGNNIFNMGNNWWDRKRLLESPITAAEAQSMSNPFMQVNEVDLRGPGRIPVAEGGSGMHPGIESGYQPNYGVQNPIPKNISPPHEAPMYRTPRGTPAVASSPKLTSEARKTYTGYTKSLDKTFAVAALQSAMPQNDQTPVRQAPSGGGRGGGNRMDQMTQYASAIPLDEEKYPMLWRYS